MDEDHKHRESLAGVWEKSIGAADRSDQTLKPHGPVDRPVAGEATVVSATASAYRAREHQVFHGDRASEYALLDVLGEGGMGIIFRARHVATDRTVALKVIRPESADSAADRAHFRAEAIATAELEHPNIVPIHEFGVSGEGAAFYAMKEVHGTRWSESIGQKTLDENLQIWLRVADGVAFAHSRGIIHRDLKPENVMLGDFGEVLVVDWGLTARVGEGGVAQPLGGEHATGGTPCYMAPEMARAEADRIGPASDIYLLGAVLYEIVTGRPPHVGVDVMQCIEAAAENRIEPTELQGELIDAARRAMADDPGDRFPDVKAFQETVREYRRHQESIALAAQADTDLEQAQETGRYAGYAEAVSGYEQALKLWPANPRVAASLSAARLAYAQNALGRRDLDLAMSVLDAQDAGHAQLRHRVGAVKRERDTREQRVRLLKRAAVGSLVTALAAVTVALLWVTLSRGAERRQRRIAEQALVDFTNEQERRMADRKMSAPAMVRSAWMLADDGDFAAAREVAVAALESDGTLYDARLLVAMTLVRSGDYGSARAQCEAVLADRPDDRDAMRMSDVCPTGSASGIGADEGAALVSVAVEHGVFGLAAAFAASPQQRLDLYRRKLEVVWGPRSGHLKLGADGSLAMDMAAAPEAADLRPLRGIPLRRLRLRGSAASDLKPLAGMPLECLDLSITHVTDLSPLAGMPLTNLSLWACQVTDLSPLRGAPIRSLDLSETPVTDLGPLLGMPLEVLNLQKTPVGDLGPVAGARLTSLNAGYTQVCDLRPLAGMALQKLSLALTRASDLRPLAGMPLRELNISSTGSGDLGPLKGMPLEYLVMGSLPIADLAPLRGMPLKRLAIRNMKLVHDLRPLAGMPLEELTLDIERVHFGLTELREMSSLKTINGMPATEFWARYDGGEYGASGLAQGEEWHAYPPPKEFMGDDSGGRRPAVAARARRHPLTVRVPGVWVFSRGPGPSVYYMDNNFSANGNPMVGQIDYGAFERDADTGVNLHVYTNVVDGARSAVALGDYIFLTGGDCQGIRRLDRDWANPTPYGNGGTDPEAIATDGRWLFANNDRERALIHAYSVRNEPTSFVLEEQWRCDLGRGRVRGVSYGGNGYLYVSVGVGCPDRSVLAVRASDGQALDTGIDVPGEDEVFGVIRHNLAGRSFLVAVGSHILHVWELADDLSPKRSDPDSYTAESLGIQPWMRGASARGNRLFVSFDRYIACFELSADPPGDPQQ